ncbi:MAG: zinc ABC transporter substrate-binding protein [Thermoplasmata archaeon]
MQRNSQIIVAVVIVCALVGTGIYVGYVLGAPASPCGSQSTSGLSPALKGPSSPSRPPEPTAVRATPQPTQTLDRTEPANPATPGPVIQAVAAENFWGSLVSQLGGTHVNVTSIVTDPNTDPHEYQANDSDAIAIKNAQYVIVNNVGYDQWATGLIASDGDSNQTILNVGDSLGVSVNGGIVTGNPHLWYNPTYVNDTVAWMFHNLTTIAPSLTGYFTAQYDNLTASLGSLYSRVTQIKDQFHGTEVASTESIFVYLANATDLDLVSPPAFMEAIAEGNDPPDPSVVEFQCQLESGNVKVLVYNEQTVTPITKNMKAIAAEYNVTTFGVTETIQPPDVSFQDWMMGELDALQNALNANALGQ